MKEFESEVMKRSFESNEMKRIIQILEFLKSGTPKNDFLQ